MELREYQRELIDKIKAELRKGKRSVCAVLGCGGGKSVIQGSIAKMTTDKGNRVLFLVHRRELCRQIRATFEVCGVDFGLCEINMIQTAARRLDSMSRPNLIITDECHHALSNSYRKIYAAFPNAVRLGFTATPCRLGTGGLGEVFDCMVEGVSTEWLIENKYLSPYRYYSVKLVDTSGLHTKAGEFVSGEIASLMEKNYVYGEALKSWEKIARNKKTIIYCASIKQSREQTAAFAAAGYSAAHLDGETPANEREDVVEGFRNGEITVLSNVDLFGEGFDVPDCECVILLRPTKSLTLHIQQSMRSMRYKEGKTAIIIDNVGNVYRHGLPDDVREWTLEGRKKREKAEIKLKECKVCFHVVKATEKKCPVCGYEFPTEKRETERETVYADIVELSKEDFKRLKNMDYYEYKKFKTWDELYRFGKARKYHILWAVRKARELGIEIPEKYIFLRKRVFGY